MTDASIRWVAELSHVREVSLYGTADLAYWTDQLAPHDLRPLGREGKASLLIIAVEGRFRGVRFRELSFSVAVDVGRSAHAREGAYLVQAYNSSRFFAWCERTFFSTPYSAGDVAVAAADPVSVELRLGAGTVFRVARTGALAAAAAVDGGWDGIVFLPSTQLEKDRSFYARVRGATTTLPFDPASDTIEINADPAAPVLRSLLNSRFAPTQWQLRPDATHAKSTTYSRKRALRWA
jgi:hypothetical protein